MEIDVNAQNADEIKEDKLQRDCLEDSQKCCRNTASDLASIDMVRRGRSCAQQAGLIAIWPGTHNVATPDQLAVSLILALLAGIELVGFLCRDAEMLRHVPLTSRSV